MKLLEFFSKNDESDVEDQTNDDVKKEVMAFILDDDEIFKQHMLPLVHKIESGKDVSDKDYSELVKDGCLRLYKKKQMNIDPNEVFPKSMRQQIAKELHSINKSNAEKKK
jgi:hypothetical protein